MKTYIVWVNGNEAGIIKAGGHNAAEKKAQKMYPEVEKHLIQVEYTEL